MFTGEQILRELVAAFIDVTHRAGEVILDAHARGTAEVICEREDFLDGFATVNVVLRGRSGRAYREQFRVDSNKPREQQLLAIELWPEPRHGVKQTTR